MLDFWLGEAANIAQILSVLVPVIIWKILQCRVPWCYHRGQHDVDGTHYKVCAMHYHAPEMKALQEHHARKYPHQH